MFVGDEVRLDVSFAVARERLTRLGPALAGASEDAYGLAQTRVGVAGVSKLVRVQVSELSWSDLSAGPWLPDPREATTVACALTMQVPALTGNWRLPSSLYEGPRSYFRPYDPTSATTWP